MLEGSPWEVFPFFPQHISSSPILLEAIGLTKFANNAPIFINVDLQLREGEHLFITGKSGSGKSLFLKALAFLTSIDDGEIRFYGQKVSPTQITKYRSSVQYFPQFYYLGRETIATYFQRVLSLKVYRPQNLQFPTPEILEVLHKMSLPEDFLYKKTVHLSGGEVQITNLLRMVLLRPKVLLLDEPTSAMDAATRLQAEQIILQYLQQQNASALWITHDLAQVQRLGPLQTEVKTITIN